MIFVFMTGGHIGFSEGKANDCDEYEINTIYDTFCLSLPPWFNHLD